MPLVLKDRVKELTTSTGTGAVTLAGAVTGYQSFAAIGDGNTTYYVISGGSEWEVGIGTYTASGTTLSRGTVLASSNAGSLVNFSAGTKDVICSYPADKAVYEDENNKVGINTAPGSTQLYVYSNTNTAIYGNSTSGYGAQGQSSSTYGVYGKTTSAAHGGVLGYNHDGTRYGILGYANIYAFYGVGDFYINGDAYLNNGGLGTTAKISVLYAGGGAQYGMVMRPQTNDTIPIQFQNASGTTVGSISITTTTTTYGTTSDYRVKENIAPISNASSRVLALNPIRFTWVADPDHPPVDGFLAHEVSSVVPEAITGEKDAVDSDGNMVLQGIDQAKLVPLLTAGLQEALNKISQLEARIALLEAGP